MALITTPRVQADVQAWTPQGVHYHQALMGDLKTITTTKPIDQPYGTFTLTLTMREDTGGSWADRLPYRTYVEIRAHSGETVSGPLPILMRGFVDAPGQTLQMPGVPGGPQREVTVSGRDLGVILADWQILYLWGIDPMALYLNASLNGGDPLANQLGVSVGEQSPTRLLTAFVRQLVNTGPRAALRAVRSVMPAVPWFDPVIRLPEAYRVNFLSLQPWQGSYTNFLDYFSSPPWGEAFVYDAQNAPQIVVRQTPYKTYTEGIYPLAQSLGSPAANGFFPDVTLRAGEVIAHDLTINGADQIYTYYSTTPDLASALGQSYAQFFYVSAGTSLTRSTDTHGQIHTTSHTFGQQTAVPTSPGAQNPTVQTSVSQAQKRGGNPYFDAEAAKLWGIRPLQLTTPWVSTLQQTFGSPAQKLVADLNSWLVAVYRHHDRFVTGTITCHGKAEYTIGRYVTGEPGAVASDPRVWEGYISQVSHQIDLVDNTATWVTDLGIVRGRLRS